MAIAADEIVTYYVIEISGDLGKRVQAWTDDKDLALAYMDFHRCKRLKLKKMTNTHRFCMQNLINQNNHDELGIMNIYTKKPGSDDKFIMLAVPMTNTEMSAVNVEIQTFMADQCYYQLASKSIGFLKNKYQRALDDILYSSFMKIAMMEKEPPGIFKELQFDYLRILYRLFPTHFGS